MPKKFLEIAPEDVQLLKGVGYTDEYVKCLDDAFYCADWIEENKAKLKDKQTAIGVLRVFKISDVESSGRFKHSSQGRVLDALALLQEHDICGAPFLDREVPEKRHDMPDPIEVNALLKIYCAYKNAERLSADWQASLIQKLVKAKLPPDPPKEARPQYMAVRDFPFEPVRGTGQTYIKKGYVFTDPVSINAILADPHLFREGYVRPVDEVTMYVCDHCGKASAKK